jgi:glycosyltransferase involved in cell wall biosynthesis
LYVSRDDTAHDRRFLQGLADQGIGELFAMRLEQDGIPYETRPLPPGVHPVEWVGGRRPLPRPEDWLSLLPAFAHAVETVRPDLIHAGPLTSCGFLAAVVDACPLVAMSWASDVLLDAQEPPWRWMVRYTLERAALLACDADAVRAAACALVPRPPERIVQFPWGVDLQHFRPAEEPNALRRSLGWEQARVVVWTRTWEPLYDLATGLEAFRLAAARDPSLRLLLLGDGSQHQAMTDWIAQHRLQSIVHCAGRVSNQLLPAIVQAANVYLSCARCDGSSVSLLEAMAMGLVPVVTDLPSNREWLPSAEHGWLVPAGDAEAFAAALSQAAELSSAARRRLRASNRAAVEARANWPANLRRLVAAYERLLGDDHDWDVHARGSRPLATVRSQ